MVLDFFKGSGGSIEAVEHTLVQMLHDGRAVYDAATEAVFGGGKSKETKREVKGTDRQINKAQQEVRRALMVHSAVSGDAHMPLVLSYMSVVKDVERVGDYAKNLYDLARYGADFSVSDDREQLQHYCDAVGNLIDEAAAVFEERDTARAQELITKADGFLDEYDDHIQETVQSDRTAFDATTRALYFTYLKRITAHVMNLMTSLVLPVDRLDYYDEARDDREPGGSPITT
jgi:phosphate uptake regulator